MICNKCGEIVQEDKNFCPSCGAKIDSMAPISDGPSLNYTAVTPKFNMDDQTEDKENTELFVESENFVEKESVFEPLKNSTSFYSGSEVQISKKTGNGKKIAVFAIAIIAFIAIIGGLIYVLLPQIQRSLMSEQEYYISKEKENILKVRKELDAFTKSAATNGKYGFKSETTTSIKGDNIPTEASDLINKLKIVMEIASDAETKQGIAKADITIDGRTAPYMVETDGKRTAVSFPGFADGKYVEDGDAQWLVDLMQGKDSEYLALTGMKKTEFDGIIKTYFEKVIIEAFPEDSIVKGKADFKGNKCTTVEFLLNKEANTAMLTALIAQLEADKTQNIAILRQASSYLEVKASAVPSGGYSEFKSLSEKEANDAYQEILDELKFELEYLENDTDIDDVSYKVYYDKRGEIVARQLTADGQEMTFATYKKDGNNVAEVTSTVYGAAGSVINTYSKKDNIISGTLVANYSGEDVATATYTVDINSKTGNQLIPLINGEVKLDGGLVAIEMVNTDENTLNFSLKVKLDDLGELGANTRLVFNAGDLLADISIPEKSTMTEDELEENVFKIMESLYGYSSTTDSGNYSDDDYNVGEFDDEMTGKAMFESMYGDLLKYDLENNPDEYSQEQLAEIEEIMAVYAAL